MSKELEKVGGTQMQSESTEDKFKRKFLENPFVPIGCFTTAGVLMYGLYAFKQGDSKLAQLMMRYRIAAQGFTITAAITGLYLTAKQLEKNEHKE